MLDLSKKCRICLKDLENFAISVRSEITFGDSGQELSILNMLAFCNQQIVSFITNKSCNVKINNYPFFKCFIILGTRYKWIS